MLQIALPNKGALAEEAVRLVAQAGYCCERQDRELTLGDPGNGVAFVFLRPRDIATYVSRGIIGLGITGRDLALDSGASVAELLALGFGRTTFRYAAPAGSGAAVADLGGRRIATSYPRLVRQDLARRGIAAEVVTLDGAVEVAVALGVADAIADVVQTGRTLEQAGLQYVGEPILESEAVVIARDAAAGGRPGVAVFLSRVQGIVTARDYVMVEYDIPEAHLASACRITPGIESPTVAPLCESGWKAVKAMARREEVNRILDELAAIGAKGILITDIRTCRL
jgi:ATP phosphoribosyltransferase